MSDKELIEKTIRTNLKLITSINLNPDSEGVVFRKDLLVRGIEVLQRKDVLTDLERSNLQWFNSRWNLME